jgi:two-component system, cell cycle response regulator
VARPANILVVDDSRAQLGRLLRILERDGHAAAGALDGKEAIRAVQADPPDLVLLDLVLPDMDGIEVLRFIKARPEEQFIPVIIMSARSDLDSKVTGLRIGADDFLSKPFAEAELLARCAAMLRIKQLQERLRETQARLAEQLTTDPLTGMKNRRFFDERLEEEFRRAERYGDCLALLMIDLDHFKSVNDRFGHPGGDLVLREAATLIRNSIRDPDICARYGGEEFAVILPKTGKPGAIAVAERMWREIGKKEYIVAPAATMSCAVRVTASIGVAFHPAKDITSGDHLLVMADKALYQAKRAGRNTIGVHEPGPQAPAPDEYGPAAGPVPFARH